MKAPVGRTIHGAIRRLAAAGNELAKIQRDPSRYPDCDSDHAIREWEMAVDELPHLGIDL